MEGGEITWDSAGPRKRIESAKWAQSNSRLVCDVGQRGRKQGRKWEVDGEDDESHVLSGQDGERLA